MKTHTSTEEKIRFYIELTSERSFPSNLAVCKELIALHPSVGTLRSIHTRLSKLAIEGMFPAFSQRWYAIAPKRSKRAFLEKGSEQAGKIHPKKQTEPTPYLIPDTIDYIDRLIADNEILNKEVSMITELAASSEAEVIKLRGEVNSLHAQMESMRKQISKESELRRLVQDNERNKRAAAERGFLGPGRSINDNDVRTALITNGWRYKRQGNGDHLIFEHPRLGMLPVPQHIDVGFKPKILSDIAKGIDRKGGTDENP